MSTTERFVVISGCSGGGKSALLAELDRRGFTTIEEPGRRIVREEEASSGRALPWIDGAAFARRAITMALADRAAASAARGWVFFDRGLVDAANALRLATGERVLDSLRREHRYARRVFLAPPWPEIYATDAERRHGFEEAEAEYHQLAEVYPMLGYEVVTLPKASIRDRAKFALNVLADLNVPGS